MRFYLRGGAYGSLRAICTNFSQAPPRPRDSLDRETTYEGNRRPRAEVFVDRNQREDGATAREKLRAGYIGGWLVLGVGSTLGGLLTRSVGLPAAWLVGPLLVAVVFALTWREHLEMPRVVQRASQAVIGVVLATTFQPSVLPLIAADWLPVGLAIIGTLLASFLAGLFLTRVARLDGTTAALGTLPGAASGMLAMSGPLGADPRIVALIQYGRVVLVIVSASLISRFGLASSGPADGSGFGLGTAARIGGSTHGVWPAYVVTALIAAVGAWAGTRLRRPVLCSGLLSSASCWKSLGSCASGGPPAYRNWPMPSWDFTWDCSSTLPRSGGRGGSYHSCSRLPWV